MWQSTKRAPRLISEHQFCLFCLSLLSPLRLYCRENQVEPLRRSPHGTRERSSHSALWILALSLLHFFGGAMRCWECTIGML